MIRGKRGVVLLTLLIAVGLVLPAYADHDPVTDGPDDHGHVSLAPAGDLSDPLEAHDATTSDVVSSGPSTKKIKNLALVGRGERLLAGATTDVWAHDGFAYLGTFNNPCGTGAGYVAGVGAVELQPGPNSPGIPVFDVANPTNPTYVGNIPSVAGSRINDVKVASMNQGDILVHSNEPCAGGPGGFEVYNVDDPTNPVHLARVQTDDINAFLRTNFDFVDFGVHNLYLFTRDGRDYAAAQVEGLLGSFQVFDISDPADPELVTWFGAEYLLDPTIDWATTTDFPKILEANDYLLSGFGASANRFLHDHWISPDGTHAFLANWDAGLLLVDLGDLDGTAATLISQALDPTSEDGEVNSHSVWPSKDGTVVIEGEEDFNPFETIFSITSGPDAGSYSAVEGVITVPIASLDPPTMAGPTTYVGLACPGGDAVPAAPTADAIALIQRGVCSFTEKIDNAEAAGYSGVVVFNSAVGGDALVVMGGVAVNLPGVFVGRSTGLTIAGVANDFELTIGAPGESIDVSVVPNGWSGFRIWDYSDPANPILASTFNTVCSADPVDPSCDPAGTYSSHNVIVESLGGRVKAYISWYSDGMLVLDITDPYHPVEVARYFDNSPEFLASNGGEPHDFWGVYKEPNKPWIYGSDRNGGLYIFQEIGKGTGGRR